MLEMNPPKANCSRGASEMTTLPATSPSLSGLTTRPEWRALQAHADQMRGVHLRTLFASDAQRGTRFVAEAAGLYMDFSKHRITSETLDHLVALANSARLTERIAAMFRGERINVTENRPVLHVALRAPRSDRSSSTATT